MSGRRTLSRHPWTTELALLATSVAIVVPLWAARFLPFTDLPEHVAAIATLAHWYDPAWQLQSSYEVVFDRSYYLLYHLVGAGLARLVGNAELGHRLLLTAVGMSYPYAMRALLRAWHRDERLALFAGIPFWSRSLVVGFLPYVASVPALLFALALLLRWLERPTRRREILLALAGVALFFLHLNAFLLFALLTVTLAVLWPPLAHRPSLTELRSRLRAAPRRLLWFLPALLAAGFWTARGSLARGAHGVGDPGEIYYLPSEVLPRQFPLWAHDVFRSHVDELTTAVFWLLVLWLGMQRSALRGMAWVTAWVPLLTVLVLYVSLPFTVGAGGMLNVRLALFFGLFVLLLLEVPKGWRGRVPLVLVLLTTLVTSANAVVQVRRAEREELGDFDRILSSMRPGTRVLGLNFRQTSRIAPFFPWVHLMAYHRARGGLIASVSFSELPHWPIHYRVEAAPPKKSKPFWEFSPCLFRNASDGAYYDYVLARGSVDPFRDEPPGPRWSVRAREREFVLYEKDPAAPPFPLWRSAEHVLDDQGPCTARRTLEARPP